MNGKKKIELDSIFFNISGKNINKFIKNIINEYSFPPNDMEV